MAKRSVPGAQTSMDPDVLTRPCPRCDGEGYVSRPRIRVELSAQQAEALLAGEGPALADAREALERGLERATTPLAIELAPPTPCPDCGGQGVITHFA